MGGAVTPNNTPDESAQKLWDELVLLRDVWNQYNALYRNSNDVAVLLARSARSFFRSHAGLLSREVILRVARLTDNEETGAQRNLVLRSILNDAGIDAVPGLREELRHELEELHELSKAVRQHRHKYLAHLDHAVATGATPPAPPVTWDDIARLIDSVERIYHRYRSAVYDSDADFVLHALGGPADLVRVLRAGEQWRAHVQQILLDECT
jgi:hypothetical protein